MADKKRKGTASVSTPPTKKSKKAGIESSTASAPATAPAANNAATTSTRTTRKHAADILEETEDPSRALGSENAKVNKKSRKTTLPVDRTTSTKDNSTEVGTKDDTERSKLEVQSVKANGSEIPLSGDNGSEEDDGEDEDQGVALLTGFDSDNDDPAEDQGDLSKLQPIPQFKKTSKKLKQAKEKGSDTPGAVYIGRIPHGFYEHQMREYFSQFGDITKLRLSRNKRTGASKHFAFVEFASDEVAKIVAETMDNYLMFGHILKCKYAPADSLHPDVWKGANKKYRKIPYDKLQRQQLEAPKTQEQWAKKNEREQRRRQQKAEKMKAIGYEYVVPQLKTPASVVEQKRVEQTHGIPQVTDNDQADAILAPPPVPVDEKAEKTDRKAKKDKARVTGTRQSLTEHNLDVQDAGIAAESAESAGQGKPKEQNGVSTSTDATKSIPNTKPRAKKPSTKATSVTSNNEFDNLSSIPVGTEAMTNHPDEQADYGNVNNQEPQTSLDTFEGIADTVLRGRKDDRKKRSSGHKSAQAQAAAELSKIAPGAMSRGKKEKETKKRQEGGILKGS